MSKSWVIYNPLMDCFWRHKSDSWQQVKEARWDSWQPISFFSELDYIRGVVTREAFTDQFIYRMSNAYCIEYEAFKAGDRNLDLPLFEGSKEILNMILYRKKVSSPFEGGHSRITLESVLIDMIDKEVFQTMKHCLVIDPKAYYDWLMDGRGSVPHQYGLRDPSVHIFDVKPYLASAYEQVEPHSRNGHVLMFESAADAMRFKLSTDVKLNSRDIFKYIEELLAPLSAVSGRKFALPS